MNSVWYKIANHISDIDFQQNNIAVIDLDHKKICIGKYKDSLFAFAYTCPHASGILAEGFIDALGNVVCPQHSYRYSIQNGRNVSGEGFYLKHWPVEIRKDGIYVGL